MVVPTKVCGEVSVGLTVPEAGMGPAVGRLGRALLVRVAFVFWPASEIRHKSKMLLKTRSALSATRAFVEDELFFIFGIPI